MLAELDEDSNEKNRYILPSKKGGSLMNVNFGNDGKVYYLEVFSEDKNDPWENIIHSFDIDTGVSEDFVFPELTGYDDLNIRKIFSDDKGNMYFIVWLSEGKSILCVLDSEHKIKCSTEKFEYSIDDVILSRNKCYAVYRTSQYGVSLSEFDTENGSISEPLDMGMNVYSFFGGNEDYDFYLHSGISLYGY